MTSGVWRGTTTEDERRALRRSAEKKCQLRLPGSPLRGGSITEIKGRRLTVPSASLAPYRQADPGGGAL